MRTAARTKGARTNVAQSVSFPAPVGGWNARDPLAAMPVKDAVVLKNWFPGTTECILRYGFTEWATGLPDQVESLLNYEGGATSELFAVSDGACYDISTTGPVGAAVWSAKANSRFQYCNIATAGGNYMMVANGADAVQHYNGTVWAAPVITGVTPANLNNPILHKSRVWFTENNTLKTWFLPTLSVAGAAASLDMSAVAQLGGYIVSHATWTIDAGVGMDDHYVAVTSKGEVIVYQGTDPTDSTKWALKGVWRVGSPVGTRCLFKYAGDLLIISQDGILPLSAALQSSRVNPKVALTDNIQSAVSSAVSDYGTTFGWQLIYFARENQLWLNVPVSVGSQEQYAMNTITKAWGQYTGWPANCWEMYGESPFFGGDGVVCKAWDGHSDNDEIINSQAIQSFSHLRSPGNLKRFTMMRPILRASGSPAMNGEINTDFDLSAADSSLSFSGGGASAWDYAVWDSSVWSGGLEVFQRWQGVSGIGYYAAPQLTTSSKDIDVRWVSTDIVYEVGSII